MEVRHTSLNAAELYFAEHGEPGQVIGFDSAGVVVRAAANGDGPQVGSRVVGFGEGGGFAALCALDVADLAVIPDADDVAPEPLAHLPGGHNGNITHPTGFAEALRSLPAG
ncbi:hypothetical protein OG885_05555 [Streptomyces sp. NBC_00028]